MALSDANKAAVRRYLGFADINRDAQSSIEGAMNALSAEGESVVTGILTQLDTIMTSLQGQWSYLHVRKAEDVTLDSPDAARALRAEGRRLANELAATLDVQVNRDIFGSGASCGVARRGA